MTATNLLMDLRIPSAAMRANMKLANILFGLAAAMTPAGARPAAAIDLYQLSIKDHRFLPADITVPAGEKFRLEVRNGDDTPEEFESHELKIEKIIVGGGTISVLAGPLAPGHYRVFGDYHPEVAVATVTAVRKE